MEKFCSRPFWTLSLSVLAFLAGVLAVSPQPPSVVDTGWDKLNHLLAFAAIAFCAQRAAAGSRWHPVAWQALVAGYGLLIELAQTQLPGRHGEWRDLLANMAGIAIGAAIGWWTLRVPGPSDKAGAA